MRLFGSKGGGKHSSKAINKSENKKYNKPVRKKEYSDDTELDVDEILEIDKSEKKKKGRGKKLLKAFIIILLVLAALLAAAYATVYIIRKPPELGSGAEGRTKGVYTVLVAGVDPSSGNTDTIMIARFDTENEKLNVVSIPRDTLVNQAESVKKANSIFHYAYYDSKEDGRKKTQAYKDGAEAMYDDLVYAMCGFKVDCYAIIETDVAAKLVDIIGGVTFDVPVDMHYTDPEQDLEIDIDKGVQKLNGDDFVKVMRFRDSYAGGDIDRISVQHDLLMALAKQTLSLGNIPNIGEAANLITSKTTTNMKTENVLFFGTEFMKLDDEDITFYTLPGNTYGSIFGISYVFTDIEAWLQMVNDCLNPTDTPITIDSPGINIVTNIDGVFYYTNENKRLMGGASSFYNSSEAGGVYPEVRNYRDYLSGSVNLPPDDTVSDDTAPAE